MARTSTRTARTARTDLTIATSTDLAPTPTTGTIAARAAAQGLDTARAATAGDRALLTLARDLYSARDRQDRDAWPALARLAAAISGHGREAVNRAADNAIDAVALGSHTQAQARIALATWLATGDARSL